MELEHIHVGQRRLRNPVQLPAMVSTILEGGALPPILLAELEDGTIYIQDGHHRCLAYILSGRKSLKYGEYILLQVEFSRAMFGKLIDPNVQIRLIGNEAMIQQRFACPGKIPLADRNRLPHPPE